MHRSKLKFCINNLPFLSLVLIIVFWSCQNNDRTTSSVQMIRDLKKLSKDNLTELDFGCDTIYLQMSPGKNFKRIFAKNTGAISLNVSTIVASCNCTRVSFDRKVVLPKDSLGIDLIIQNDTNFARAALTVVGNVPNGQKTVYIFSK